MDEDEKDDGIYILASNYITTVWVRIDAFRELRDEGTFFLISRSFDSAAEAAEEMAKIAKLRGKTVVG